MPQLDTSTWFITVLSSTLALFSILQLKIHSQTFIPNPTAKTLYMEEPKSSWEYSWTKIYLPLSLPLQ